MVSKRLPITRTVVSDFEVNVIDAYSKVRSLKASKSIAVMETDTYVSSDAVLTLVPTVIRNITKCLLISTYQPFRLDITQGASKLVGVHCTGFFIFYGSIDEVAMYLDPVDPALPTPTLRVTYQYV